MVLPVIFSDTFPSSCHVYDMYMTAPSDSFDLLALYK